MGEMKIKKVLFNGRLEADAMTLNLFNMRLIAVEKEIKGIKEILLRHINEGIKKEE